MKVKSNELNNAIEKAIKYNCECADSELYRAVKVIQSFIVNDKYEIEDFKRMVISYLTSDTNIEVI